MTNKVLVIIPVYNGSVFLNETIASIKSQNGVKVEIIVIDDCSTDSSYCLANKIAGISVYRNEKNMGNYYSCNKMLKLAIADPSWSHYTFHGADDVSYPNRFIRQLSLFDSLTLAVGCQFVRVDYKTKRKYPVNPKTNESQLIFSRKVIDLIGYRDNGRAGCDTEYKKRLLLAAPNSIKNVDSILMSAYFHENNLTRKFPIGGEYRKRYINEFTQKHQRMKQERNFYQDFIL